MGDIREELTRTLREEYQRVRKVRRRSTSAEMGLRGRARYLHQGRGGRLVVGCSTRIASARAWTSVASGVRLIFRNRLA